MGINYILGEFRCFEPIAGETTIVSLPCVPLNPKILKEHTACAGHLAHTLSSGFRVLVLLTSESTQLKILLQHPDDRKIMPTRAIEHDTKACQLKTMIAAFQFHNIRKQNKISVPNTTCQL
jgi:hypothetical protein